MRKQRLPAPTKSGQLDALRAAVAHHRAGRLDRAEEFYRRALRLHPDNPDALHLMGVLALDRGRPARAIQLISQALRALPDFADAHLNLGNAQRAAGDLPAAAASYGRALALAPNSAAAHSNLARVLNEQGAHADALDHADRALAADPALTEAHINRAHALRALGRAPEAEAASKTALILPANAETSHDLGELLAALGQFAAAQTCQERVLARVPDHPRALLAMGGLLRRAGDHQAAIAACRRAVRVAPNRPEGWTGLGHALRTVGAFDEAISSFRRALTLDPDAAEAHRGLALTGVAALPEALTRLHAILRNSGAPIDDRVSAGFALGRAMDGRDECDAAFAAYAEANTLFRDHEARAGCRFDADALRAQVDRILANDGESDPAAATATEMPVFIVGMPRSGTSLIEQILASHPDVFGAGELTGIGAIATGTGTGAASFAIRERGRAHLEYLAGLGGGRARVIDKMPDNIFELDLIASLYPGARVILSTRDARDTSLSCYFQRFSGSTQLFSYDLTHCAERHRQVDRLLARAAGAPRLRTIQIRYETLVGDLEAEARRMLGFLDLPWDDRCLEFHRTDRPVLTASSFQVRQPLYGNAVGRWRAYAAHLGPLVGGLGEG